VPGILLDYNREWHVVVEHPGLARMFERFIEWDIEKSREASAPESLPAAPPALPELLVPAPSVEALPRYFPPARMTFNSAQKLRVQPLLTPDNYSDEVLRLIESAQEKVYFQNQSIGFAKNNYADFLALIDALRRKMDDGLDVRLILRGDFGPRVMLENLVARGFDSRNIKFQSNCHTKGIVVDSRAVLVSSHNWTNSGTLFNRDAGLIFHNARVARYYEDIFLHDWEHLAEHIVQQEAGAPVVASLAGSAGQEEATPPGMVRVPWNVYYED
jgi:phosphatidylserine/phosphatidylglycerophosphate/cardiolipin synthase-like enzyme